MSFRLKVTKTYIYLFLNEYKFHRTLRLESDPN